ncbi:MAG TPA: choice-of-anchor L domain-containing protein, partial [Pseudohaliea sp.]|nr:choice-of-anchor L domain-containing protein [Pseudohaliea sp.]
MRQGKVAVLFTVLLSALWTGAVLAQPPTVQPAQSASVLGNQLALGGVTISNAVFTGNPDANGLFANGAATVGIEEGVILS